MSYKLHGDEMLVDPEAVVTAHPGPMVRDELAYAGVGVANAARQMGVTPDELEAVLRGDAWFSASMLDGLAVTISAGHADLVARMQEAHRAL